MTKPDYAIAMELRQADKELDKKFKILPDKIKWKWLLFACENKPFVSLSFARTLVDGEEWFNKNGLD